MYFKNIFLVVVNMNGTIKMVNMKIFQILKGHCQCQPILFMCNFNTVVFRKRDSDDQLANTQHIPKSVYCI